MRRLLLISICVAIAAGIGLATGEDLPRRSQTPDFAVAGPAAAVVPDTTPIDDPFPILRVRAGESQIPAVLKQPNAGPLVQLSRSEFEARVRSAGRQIAEARTVPHLTHSRYSAKLIGGDLVGTAELDLVNESTVSQFLSLDPLRLALTPSTWADGRVAIVGVPQGGTATSIWVDQPGKQTLKFGWSSAGLMEFGERRFELRVPSAPTIVMDLELPVGQRPTVPTDVLLTGPFPSSGDASKANWQFRFGGKPRLDFAVRSTSNSGLSASSNLVARYDISPGQLNCTFEYDLRPAKGTVGEWLFTVDPGLRVTDVVVNNRAGWSIDPPAVPGGPRRLRVSLNQPGIGGKVMVMGFSPFPDLSRPADAPLPVIRPVGAVVDEETMEIHLAQELKPARWSTGDYRLTDSQTLPDQSCTFTLYGTLLPPGSDRVFRQTPTLATNPTEPEFSTREQVAWRFDADRVTAQLQLGIRIRRSPLFRLTVRPPQGYSFVEATSPQDDLIASSQFSAGNAIVDFSHPLMMDQTAELIFEFRGPPAGPNRFQFPAFTPVGASERLGVLGIIPGPHWSIEAVPGVGMTPTSWLDLNSLRPPIDSKAAYRYRGGNPDGWVTLMPARPEFTAEMENHTERDQDRIVAKTTIALRVRTDSLQEVFITEPEAGFAERKWKVVAGGSAIASAVPIPLANLMRQFALLIPGMPGRLGAVPAWRGSQPGRLWVIRFTHPVTDEIVLEAIASRPIAKGQNTPAISPSPLTVLGAVESHIVPDSAHSQSPRQSLSRDWAFSDLFLVTVVRSEDEVEVVLGGVVTAAAASRLPIKLPVGAEVRATCVGGRWLERGVQQLSASGILAVPLSATEATRFEVRYRLPVEPEFPTRIHSPEPGLPGDPEIHRWWAFGTNLLPGWPVRAWDRGKSADLPSSLDGSPIAGPGVMVSRSQVAEVRIGSTRSASITGVALAAALFLLAWMGGRRRHRIYGLLAVAGLLVAGMTNLVGPPWWQRAFSIPLTIGLLTTAGMVLIRGRRAAVALTAGMAVSFAFFNSTSPAQPPSPAVVVILPPGADGGENVVAPKAVLDRLAAISRPLPPGASITAADYTVNVDEFAARVVAKFTVHAFADANLTAILPLTDARLERVTVDGIQAITTAPRPGNYAVALPSVGRHEVEVRFGVALTASGTERELRFGVPECPTTRVTAQFPNTARQIQLVGRAGKQAVDDGEPRHFDADVGAVKAMQIRWRDGGVGTTASIKAREACVWDVSEKGAELTACCIFRIDQGSVSRLQFDLPAELEPIEVSLRADATGGTSLRDWSLAPEQPGAGMRQLRLDLQGPTTGRMLVVLSCRLRKAATLQPLLRFPKPAIPGGIAEPDATFGLRAKDVANKVTIDASGQVGMIDYDPESLTRDRDWTQIPALRLDTNTPIRVFRPAPKGNPELRPTLHLAVGSSTVNLETSWQVEPHRADAAGTIHWTGKEPLSSVEFVIPGLKILEVRGPEVRTWSQNAGRVSVWLRKPANEGELEWIGTASPLPAGQKPPDPFPFEAAIPRVLDASLGTALVHIGTGTGWAVRLVRDQGWTELNRTNDDLALQTTSQTAPPVRIALSPSSVLSRTGAAGVVPSPRPRTADVPTAKMQTKSDTSVSKQADGQTNSAAVPAPPWVLPVSALIGWCVAIAILALLLIRFPNKTWPEQFGLLVGLFGVAVLGHWWFGAFGWLVARLLWLAGTQRRPPGLIDRASTK